MRASFGIPQAPVLEARDLTFGELSVTELRYDAPDYGQSAPLPDYDALLISLQLRPSTRHDVWEDGKHLPTLPLARGMTSIFDLRRGLWARSVEPFHCVNFSFPLRALEEAGEETFANAALDVGPRQALTDPLIEALGVSLLPALAQPEQATRMFVDHVLFAVRAHVAQRLGASRRTTSKRGALAPWQERRARAVIDARLGENISLAEVARECELSVAQFARAFKRSTGMPPHRFLLERRIDRARELLRHTELPLADVAVTCGFADQSHFTKVFRRVAGESPGSFRAALRTARVKRP